MLMLYDSDTFVVVRMQVDPDTHADQPLRPEMQRQGFEIVDKRTGKEIYLDGSWAEHFQQQIAAWQHKTPTEEEVESTLESYAVLAQHPVLVH